MEAPTSAGIGVAREIGAYAQPDFKATRNRKSSTLPPPTTRSFVNVSGVDALD
jgi:hypothetical protein